MFHERTVPARMTEPFAGERSAIDGPVESIVTVKFSHAGFPAASSANTEIEKGPSAHPVVLMSKGEASGVVVLPSLQVTVPRFVSATARSIVVPARTTAPAEGELRATVGGVESSTNE